MKAKIDLERFICSWLKARQYCSDNECGYVVAALREQGLDYKDGEIMKIDTIDTSSPEWAEIVEECKHNNLEQAKKSNKEKLMEVDSFDAELNALLKKYEHLPKEDIAECLSFYLGVVKGDKPFDYEDANIQQKDFAPKPKWSEEDDYNVQCCIAKAERDITNGYPGRNKELIEWLKQLKQRMEE